MIDQMISFVQIYINIRKYKEVNIVIEKPSDLIKLQKAYVIAKQWLDDHNMTIINKQWWETL